MFDKHAQKRDFTEIYKCLKHAKIWDFDGFEKAS